MRIKIDIPLLLKTLPGRPFAPVVGRSVLTLTEREFYALPRGVQETLRAYHTRQYSDGVNVWIEIPSDRVTELVALMTPEVTP